MNKQQQLEQLTALAKTGQGQALKEYLEDEIDKMRDISRIESFEELIGKKIATKLLRETLGFLGSLKTEKKKGNNEYL